MKCHWSEPCTLSRYEHGLLVSPVSEQGLQEEGIERGGNIIKNESNEVQKVVTARLLGFHLMIQPVTLA